MMRRLVLMAGLAVYFVVCSVGAQEAQKDSSTIAPDGTAYVTQKLQTNNQTWLLWR